MSGVSSRSDKLPFRYSLVDSHLPVPRTGIPTYRSFADNPDCVVREIPMLRRENIKVEIEQAGRFKAALNKLKELGLKIQGFHQFLVKRQKESQQTILLVS